MDNYIDARGKACPMPVVLAKKLLDAGVNSLKIDVDNAVAVQNLQRLAQKQGYQCLSSEEAGVFSVFFSRQGAAITSISDTSASDNSKDPGAKQQSPAIEAVQAMQAESLQPEPGSWAVLVCREAIGEGSRELGENLMKMFFYTLSESEDIPQTIIFMNGGVKLPTLNEQVAEHLRQLEAKGSEILVCGTCLNYYDLTKQLKIGCVSNMFDIVTKLQGASKIISI